MKLKCPVCGNEKNFIGHQVIRADVIVDGDGSFSRNLACGLDAAVYDSGRPYGPFSCVACHHEFDVE